MLKFRKKVPSAEKLKNISNSMSPPCIELAQTLAKTTLNVIVLEALC